MEMPSQAVDWPLSREEKKVRIIRLFADEMRAVEELLLDRQVALEHLEDCLNDSKMSACAYFDGDSLSELSEEEPKDPSPAVVAAAFALSSAFLESSQIKKPSTVQASSVPMQVPSIDLELRQDLRELISYGSGSSQASATSGRMSLACSEISSSSEPRPSDASDSCSTVSETSMEQQLSPKGRWWPAGQRSPGARNSCHKQASDYVSLSQVTWKPSLTRTWMTPGPDDMGMSGCYLKAYDAIQDCEDWD